MHIRDPQSQRRCLWCGKQLNRQEDILSRISYGDCLCVECRNEFKEKPVRMNPKGIRVDCLYPYEGMGREMLLQYKELKDEALYPVFLWEKRKELQKRYRGYSIIPIPSSEKALKDRGFHHVIRMFEVLDLPVYDILEKTEETEMKKLGGEIRRQKRNILRIKEDAKIPAGKILLADDVITTGTTMKSAISQIRSKSSHVKGLCIFYHSQKRQSVKQS